MGLGEEESRTLTWPWSRVLFRTVLRSGGLKVRLAQVNCVGEFKGKGSGRVFGNDQR